MEEEIEILIDTTKESMRNALTHLEKKFSNIRAGKASAAMLGSVMVDYYGSPTPLTQVGNISTPDARTLSVQPYEKSMITEIEKGILHANLGLNPMNNGESVIISIPPLTEQRRLDLTKKAKSDTEDAKIGVRNDRKSANSEIKKLQKDGLSEDRAKNLENEVQELTNTSITSLEKLLAKKEKEIMTV